MFKNKLFLVFAAAAGAALLLVLLINSPLLRRVIFPVDEKALQPTPMILTEIKSVAKLYSQVYYDEHVQKVPEQGEPMLVIIARGRVRAGFDLSKLGANHLAVNRETRSIKIELPAVKILEVIINPSGYEIFHRKSWVTDWAVDEAKQRAQKGIERRALNKNILKRADKHGRYLLKIFFESLGFHQVEFTEPPPVGS